MSSLASPIHTLWRHLLQCSRLLIDLVTDIVFQWLMVGFIKPRNKLPRTWRLLPPVNNNVLMQSATSLARKIRLKEITSEEVVRSCIDRINEINPVLNAVVDERFASALEEAQTVDRIVSTLGEKALEALATESPFLGIPFSTKEGIMVKGMRHTYGSPKRMTFRAKNDAEAVRMLRRAGAIPLCVTNVSELGCWWESSNPIYGVTKNPYDILRTPGGSSGGEAALQTAAGIPLSLGSDTGGSIRTPSAFCGLFGHKPTSGVVSINGCDVVDPPSDFISEVQVVGPMLRFAEDLIPMMKVLCYNDNSDVKENVVKPKLRLDDNVPLSRLRYFYIDGGIGGPMVSPLSPEVRQGLLRVVNYIEDMYGLTVKPVRIPEMERAFDIFSSAVEHDRSYGPTLSSFLEKSLAAEWFAWITRKKEAHNFPFLIQCLMEKADEFSLKLKKWRSGELNKSSEENKRDLSPLDAGIQNLKNELLELLGNDGVLICPTFPGSGVATYHRESYFKPINVMYTAIFNAVGVPATVVPIGLSKSNEPGLPMSIQLVASPMNDRITLSLAKSLERPFGGWIPPFSESFDQY